MRWPTALQLSGVIPRWGIVRGAGWAASASGAYWEGLKSQMTTAHGYSQQKDNYAKRLWRIEGQVRGIAKMIDEDKYCIDVLTQISAVNSALRSVALNLLDEHLGHCVARAVAEEGPEAPERAQAKLAEASAAIARLVRS